MPWRGSSCCRRGRAITCARSAGAMIASYLTVPVYTAFHQWLGRGEMIAPLLRSLGGG